MVGTRLSIREHKPGLRTLSLIHHREPKFRTIVRQGRLAFAEAFQQDLSDGGQWY